MRVLGLTGGIASGKSAVADLLSSVPHIDADQVSRQVVAPGRDGLAAVVAAFGTDVLTDKGTLNRGKLRQMIATDREHQTRLNQILHPRIRQEIQRQLHTLAAEEHDVALVSAALMLETGSYRDYDAVILVTAPEPVRLKRLLARDGMDAATARQLMAKQWSDERRRPYATVEIVNDGDMATLRHRTAAAMAKLGLPDLV